MKRRTDVRSVYSQEMGRVFAFQMDKHVLRMVQAAAGTANVGDSGYASGTIITSANSGTQAAAYHGLMPLKQWMMPYTVRRPLCLPEAGAVLSVV